MKICFLESGQASKNIRRLLTSECIDEIDFAVAYLTNAGYAGLEKPLKRFLRRKGRIKFLIGMSEVYVTESRALNSLLGLAKKGKSKKLEVKYHNPKRGEFHPKLILAKRRGTLKEVMLGSSNLTSGGQKGNLEANALVVVGKSSNEDESKFVNDVKEFFRYIWNTGEILDSSSIRKYAVGEKKRAKFTKTHVSLPKTNLLPFVYMNGKRRELKNLGVLCTDCGKNFARVPLNAFYCEECADGLSVEIPSPNKTERDKKKQSQTIVLEVDGKKLKTNEVSLRCPVCHDAIDMTDEFKLWTICDECAQKRKINSEYVCKPFSSWKDRIARNLFYGINQKRINYSEK